MTNRLFRWILPTLALLVCPGLIDAQDKQLTPQIDGDWWPVAGNPNLGEWTGQRQQPVDFAIWQAGDGTWQLWSCIRGTQCGGKTRLFYRWQGSNLSQRNWEPMGIAMVANPATGETEGGLQAPHVIRMDGLYYMFYGDWQHICAATSEAGKLFHRLLKRDVSGRFSEGPGTNTRDAMVLRIDDTYYCYYTAVLNDWKIGAVFCRTSKDLLQWSDSRVVARGGRAGDGPYSSECPHVVQLEGFFYLFRTQRYGEKEQTSVYRSKEPLNFGVDDDRFFVCTLPVAAPELIFHDGQWHIAALNSNLDGIRIAKLKWVTDAGR